MTLEESWIYHTLMKRPVHRKLMRRLQALVTAIPPMLRNRKLRVVGRQWICEEVRVEESLENDKKTGLFWSVSGTYINKLLFATG